MAYLLAGYWGPETIIYSSTGTPARHAPIQVKLKDTNVLAPLYLDAVKSFQVPNPTRTDELGNLAFYAVPGSYDVSVVGSDREFIANVRPDLSELGGGGGPGGASVVYPQAVPATVWGPILHNFGFYPSSVSLFDSTLAESFEMFVVQHLSVNSLRVSMEKPTAGVALIS